MAIWVYSRGAQPSALKPQIAAAGCSAGLPTGIIQISALPVLPVRQGVGVILGSNKPVNLFGEIGAGGGFFLGTMHQ